MDFHFASKGNNCATTKSCLDGEEPINKFQPRAYIYSHVANYIKSTLIMEMLTNAKLLQLAMTA